MTTVAIADKYIEVLSVLGDVQTAVDLALQRYTIEQISAKIAQLHHRDQGYQATYGMDYAAFTQRIVRDEAFVRQIETTISSLWEQDLVDWEFCVKGVEDWTRTLQTLLLT